MMLVIHKDKWSLYFLIAASFSLVFKIFISTLGHNYDVGSWFIVSESLLKGENFYTTYRFNYAPLSAFFLGAVRWIQSIILPDTFPWPIDQAIPNDTRFQNATVLQFHMAVVFFLSLVDIWIAFLVKRHYSWQAGLVFLLNPVTLLLTGFHSQVENLGIVFGLLSVLFLDQYVASNEKKDLIISIFMLCISLLMKHILIFFPIWLFMHHKLNIKVKLLFISIPLAIFVASFIPFILDPQAWETVRNLTVKHSSFHLNGFYPNLIDSFVPIRFFEEGMEKILGISKGAKYIFITTLILIGFALRKLEFKSSFLFYLCAFAVFSSAITDQYLAIPVLFAAIHYRHPLSWGFFIYTAAYLCSSRFNLGSLPEFVRWNRIFRGLGFMSWHSLSFLFLILIHMVYQYLLSKHLEKNSIRE